MAGAGHLCAALQNRVFGCFCVGAKRGVSRSVANGVVRPCKEIAGVGHVVFSVVLQEIRTLVPAAACGGSAAPLPLLLRAQQQHRFADNTGKIGLQLHAVDPAFFKAVHIVLIAAAGIVKVVPPILGVNVGIDDGIPWVKNRLVGHIGERPGRVICHGDADSEVFQCTGRVFFPVGTVKQVVFAVYLIALGRPEATHAPAGGILADGCAASLPVHQIIGHMDRDAATVLASAVKVVPSIDSTQDKWIRRRERQLRCF